MSQLPLVSVVFIGYRRPDLLKRTLLSFLEICDYPRDRLELVLADDGSPLELVELMRLLPFDKFALSETNRGLGHNSNKGIRAASGDYIFQLQDDWHCKGPANFLKRAIRILEEHDDIQLVRYREFQHPETCEQRRTKDGDSFLVLPNLGSASREYGYTDNPHLKPRDFHERFGLYKEGVPMTVMEIDFCKRFAAQTEAKAAYPAGPEVFEHIGADDSFNPSQRLGERRAALLANPLTRYPFRLFLFFRHALRKREG